MPLRKASSRKPNRAAKAAREAREREADEARLRENEQQERERAERKAIAAYGAALTKEQQAEHDAAAIAQANAEELKLIEPGPLQRSAWASCVTTYAEVCPGPKANCPRSET